MRTIKVENGAAKTKEEEPLVKIKKETDEDHRKELATQVTSSTVQLNLQLVTHLGNPCMARPISLNKSGLNNFNVPGNKIPGVFTSLARRAASKLPLAR